MAGNDPTFARPEQSAAGFCVQTRQRRGDTSFLPRVASERLSASVTSFVPSDCI